MAEEGISKDGETVVSTVNIGTGEVAKTEGADSTKETSSISDSMNDDPDLSSTINPPPFQKIDEAGREKVEPSSAETVKTEDEDKSKEAKAKAEAEAKEATKATAEDKPRDKRIQKLVKERDTEREARIRAEERAKIFEEMGEKKGSTKEPDYKDISAMSDDEISEWQDKDPKGWAANLLRQAKAELSEDFKGDLEGMREALQTDTIEDRINTTYSTFAETNEGFKDMWEAGEIEDYMDKHPGHNAMSAYNALTSGKGEEAIKKRIDEAVKAGIEAHIKQQKVNRQVASISGDTGATGKETSTGDEELKDTKKFGGTVSAIANRLMKRRQAITGT